MESDAAEEPSEAAADVEESRPLAERPAGESGATIH